MRLLSTSEVVRIWEEGQGRRPVDRVLLFLKAALPEVAKNTLLEMSIGQRDARLFLLREQNFGSVLQCYVACPQCAEPLEFDTTVAEMQVTAAIVGQGKSELDLSVGDFMLRVRLPNSLDLSAVIGCDDVVVARRLLIERCILRSIREGVPFPSEKLPDAVIGPVVALMAESDPLSDVQLALTCPVCRYSWVSVFDIVSFFLSEIDRWCRSLLHDVHTLASAYGWHEADILAMSSWRRKIYMEMVCG